MYVKGSHGSVSCCWTHIYVLSDHQYIYHTMLAKMRNIHDKHSIELMWWQEAGQSISGALQLLLAGRQGKMC